MCVYIYAWQKSYTCIRYLLIYFPKLSLCIYIRKDLKLPLYIYIYIYKECFEKYVNRNLGKKKFGDFGLYCVRFIGFMSVNSTK